MTDNPKAHNENNNNRVSKSTWNQEKNEPLLNILIQDNTLCSIFLITSSTSIPTHTPHTHTNIHNHTDTHMVDSLGRYIIILAIK